MSAISAIDIALWDIKGKALGVPVYELLGGKTRDKVRVYASVMHITEDKNELAAQYQQLQQMGFTAAKIFCNGPTSSPDGKGEFFSSRIEREVEKVRVCREAVGPDFDFILEVHRGMTLPEAVAFGRAVEPYRPMILEDPVPPDNVDTMAEVASKIGVPIATGERAIDLRECEVLMARHVCQYIRPDVCAVGGITTSKKIAALAEAHDVLVIPHNPLGPVSTAACLQICASIPNLGIQELPGFCLNGAEDKMVKEPLRYENGCMLIPDAPGIGVELADDAEELYPARERGSNAARRAFDGAVKRLVTRKNVRLTYADWGFDKLCRRAAWRSTGNISWKDSPAGTKRQSADSFRFLFHCNRCQFHYQSIWNDCGRVSDSGRLYDWPSSAS